MTRHRAECEDCSWSFEDSDLLEVSDEAEDHARKEMHDVDLQRAVATDGGSVEGGTERDDYWKVVLECVDEGLSTYEYEYTCPVTPTSETPRGAIDCALGVAARSGHSVSGIETVRAVADADEILDDRSVGTDSERDDLVTDGGLVEGGTARTEDPHQDGFCVTCGRGPGCGETMYPVLGIDNGYVCGKCITSAENELPWGVDDV